MPYCEDPADENYENLAIFVPRDYFTAEKNDDGTYTCEINTSSKIGDYSADTAPVVMPINTPGYSAQEALTEYSSVKDYTDAGVVYVHAGCRGRDAGAPAGVTDLKAAVRYVYGLIDPRTKQIFYIAKGTKNRVFEHEKESLGSPDSEKLKLKTITDIKDAGLEVEKIIINSNLTEEEAFAAEASLINAFNYVSDAGLTNIVAGHHSAEALSVDEYERINGAAPLEEKDIRHKILVIKINRLYQRGMDEKVLYDAVRGVWRASKEKVKTVEYVFGVYNSLIVAVYKPSEWFVCKEAKDRLPRQDIVLTPKTEKRLFFVDEGYEQGLPLDDNESFYIGKSIAGLKLNQSAQNPITYLNPR